MNKTATVRQQADPVLLRCHKCMEVSSLGVVQDAQFPFVRSTFVHAPIALFLILKKRQNEKKKKKAREK